MAEQRTGDTRRPEPKIESHSLEESIQVARIAFAILLGAGFFGAIAFSPKARWVSIPLITVMVVVGATRGWRMRRAERKWVEKADSLGDQPAADERRSGPSSPW